VGFLFTDRRDITNRATSVKITEEGRQALLKLTKGDMRRALNVLQACHAAYDLTGETEVYNCTGNPHPSDIETIVNSMLTDEFTTAYNSECECVGHRDEC
jgi:replication factor C subunit 3/5